jgi:hypothetical protein
MPLTPGSPTQDILRNYEAAGGGRDVSASVPGGLSRTIGALGLSQDQAERLQASLGAGFKAAGNSAGKSPFQAFSSGAGAAMEGDAGERDKQRKLAQEKADKKFTQSSVAFKDMIAAERANNEADYRKNQGKYLAARAEAIASGAMGKAGAAWKGTPHDLINTIEADAIKMRDQFRKTAEKNLTNTGDPVDDAAIDRKVEAYKAQRYKGMGMTPQQVDKIKTMGTQPPKLPDGKPNPNFNPFEGLSEPQIQDAAGRRLLSRR